MLETAKNIIKNWSVLENGGFNKSVSIDKTAVKKYVAELKIRGKKIPHYREKWLHPENDFSFARIALVGSAVDFCFPIFENPVEKFSVRNRHEKEIIFRGSFAKEHCFWRIFGEGSVTAEKLRLYFITLSATSEFFRGINPVPLLEHRHWIMQEIMHVLEKNFFGDPLNVYEEANWNAPALIDVLARNFPQSFGDDISWLHLKNASLCFSFYKKAKLVALVYQGRALDKGSKIKPLSGMENIIAVEDYQVPRLLHNKGVLVYSSELSNIIKNYKIILRHSQPEIEIRAATTVANSFVLEELNRGLEPEHSDYWDILPLDAAEWFDGRKIEFPHHLTPTTAY